MRSSGKLAAVLGAEPAELLKRPTKNNRDANPLHLLHAMSWTYCRAVGPRDFAKRDVVEYLFCGKGSFRLEACRFDHVGPLRDFLGDEFLEILGRAYKRRGA